MNFKETYDTYNKISYNLALNYLQNKEDAEEVVQDVFVAIHRSLDKFEHQSTLSTWIYRITINKCYDFIKAKKRVKRFAFIQSIFGDNGYEIKHDKSDFNHPGVLLEQKEALENIFIAINKLAENQKMALILHKIEHLPQAQIAEIMGISAKAVESLIQRAKQNLIKYLNETREK